jgi:hypothetical protein
MLFTSEILHLSLPHHESVDMVLGGWSAGKQMETDSTRLSHLIPQKEVKFVMSESFKHKHQIFTQEYRQME